MTIDQQTNYDDPTLQAVAEAVTAALAVDPTPERAAKVKATVKARIAAAGAETMHEKNRAIMSDMLEALGRGDDAEFTRLFSTLEISPAVAMHVKRAFGAASIREIGMRTDRAEAEFGPGWLDEE